LQNFWTITPFPEFTWFRSRVMWVTNHDYYYYNIFEFTLIVVTTGYFWVGYDAPPPPPGICGFVSWSESGRDSGRWVFRR
jgi:hypothetical protein